MITVKMVEELPDGGARAEIEFDGEGLQLLVQEGFDSIIRKACNYEEGYRVEGLGNNTKTEEDV